MNHINLVLKFRLAGDGELQIKGVARIKIDGRGGLIFYDVHTGKTHTIEVGKLDSFSVFSMPPVAELMRPQTAVVN